MGKAEGSLRGLDHPRQREVGPFHPPRSRPWSHPTAPAQEKGNRAGSLDEPLATGQRPQVSVVIPVFNEEQNLPELITRCLKACGDMGESFEIVLVDDGSSDASPQIIAEAAEQNAGRIVGVLLNRNYGQHAAVMAGFAECRGEIVVTLDADLQNPPEEIPEARSQDGRKGSTWSARSARRGTIRSFGAWPRASSTTPHARPPA